MGAPSSEGRGWGGITLLGNPPRGLKSATLDSGWAPEFLLFWGHTPKDQRIDKHVLSQWWPATFSA